MENNHFSSIMETICAINRDSGLSNNIMAYRLALIIEQNPRTFQSTSTLSTQQRETLLSDLKTSLSHNSQSVENYRQSLKNQYYEQYLTKFGVAPSSTNEPQPDNFSRVNNLIDQKKQTFLQQNLSSGKHNLLFGRSSNYPFPDQLPHIVPPESPSTQTNESLKQSLIPAVMNTIMTMGKDTDNTGRVYNGIVYRLQLLLKEGIQFLNVNRKSDPPDAIAFSAYKDESNEFTITQNNLSDQETLRLITFDKQQTKHLKISDNQNKGIELD